MKYKWRYLLIDLLLRASVQSLTLWTILDELLSPCLDLEIFAWNQVLNIQHQRTVSSLFLGTTCLLFSTNLSLQLNVLLEYPKPLCFCICNQIQKMLVILLLSISTFCVSTSILLKDFHFVGQWLADSIVNLYKWACQTCWRYKHYYDESKDMQLRTYDRWKHMLDFNWQP